ncbi:hemicentin-1-like [Saccostrea cucullata]|uniref:hemicentin-1-like n=1 Tax=Saccostrea cuccullata TaxID=36930 RepID=UPI002ED49FFB
MGTLWPILSVLSLFFLQLVSLGQGLTVTINPNKNIFYSEMGGKPTDYITCESDCHASWKCTYKWYYIDGNVKYFTTGKILFRDKTIVENTTFQCYVEQSKNIYNWSHRIEIIVNESPALDTDVGIDLSGNNSETTSTEKKYGPRNVSIYSTDLEDVWEGTGYVNLTCRADCNPGCARYQIYHDERVLSNTSTTSITKHRKNSGKYSCGAYDVMSGEFVRSAEVDIDIKYGPTNVKLNSSSNLKDLWEGTGNVNLTCRADCNPPCARYQIYHDERVPSETNVTSITTDRNNSGKYICGAYDVRSRRYIKSAEVDIVIKYGPNNVILERSSNTENLLEGNGTFMLTCKADCNPQCNNYKFYHNGQALRIRTQTNIAYITKDRRNSGKYSCGAYDVKSRRYEKSAEVDIDIKYKTVSLSSTEKEMSLSVNHYLPSNVVCTIECNFLCDSDITVTKNSMTYRIIKSNQSIFNNKKAIPSDSGVYRCSSGTSHSEDDFELNILYGPRNIKITNSEGKVQSEVILTENHSEKYRLRCSFDCSRHCKISWYKDGRILDKEKGQDLSIRMDRYKSGTYECEADGVEGKLYSNTVNITVQYPPGTVVIKPSNYPFYTKRYGRPLTKITCDADCLPKCDYEWYEIKRWRWWSVEEVLLTRGTVLNTYGNFTKIFSRLRCAAINSFGKKYSRLIYVRIKDGPDSVSIYAESSEARENQPFELQCSARCYHGCLSYTWLHKKNEIHNGTNLKFDNLLRTNNGEYTCKVEDYFGTTSKNYFIKVQFGPTNVTIKYTNTDGHLVENIFGNVDVTCQADCNPACFYTFYRNGQQIRNRLGGLLIWKTKENSGRYSCSANNSFSGPINSSNFVDILIKYKPKITRFEITPTDITVPGLISLNFEVDSFPPANVTIVFNKKMLRFANVTGMESSKIEITSCLDEGDVKIIAKNNIGSDIDTKRITTKCSPMILTYSNVSNKGYNIGDPLNLTTTFMANPAPGVSWSFTSYKSRNMSQKVEENLILNKEKMTSIIVDKLDVDKFGIYQLKLVNDIGNETISFSIKGLPQPSTDLTLDCLSAAFLEWKPGFDGGTDQSFLIEYTTNISSPWLPQPLLSIASKDNDRMSTYVTLMNPNDRYFFRVISENVFGRVISDKIVNCTVQAVGGEESSLSLDTIAGISGGLVLILVAVIVLVLFGVKKYQNQIRKDCRMGMIENTLYISGDNVNNSTILSSKYPQNDAVNTESRNDVYSVVKKTEKIEPDFPMYAEVCKSRPVKDKPEIKKKPAKKTKNSTGKTVNKDGLVYVEIDLKNTPALSGNSVIHGSDNKTLYVDIDFTQHADPLPECDVEDTNDANENEKKSQQE